MLENFRLKVFRAVATHLSFRKAGEALYLTQPAVTLQIKALEEELGVRLFARSASGVRLTEAGRILLGNAEQLHAMAEEAEASIARFNGESTGHVVLGASKTIAQYVLPRHLAEFSRAFPSIHLQMFSANTEQVCDGVAEGRFGLGLIEAPSQRRDLKVVRWFEDEVVIIVAKGHEWAGLGSIAAEKFSNVPVVMRERGSGLRRIAEQALQSAGVELSGLHIAIEVDSTDTILACVEAGLGVGFASEWAVLQNAQRDIVSLRLAEQAMRRSFSFVLPQGPDPRDSSATLLRFLEARIPAISETNRG